MSEEIDARGSERARGPTRTGTLAPRPSRRVDLAGRVHLLGAGGALTLLRRNGPGPDGIVPPASIVDGRPSVAVLPFENLSTDAENAYFASGLHDEVITQLLRVAGTVVAAGGAFFMWKAFA